MSNPNWNDAPADAEFSREWLGKIHWFKRSPNLHGMWMKFEGGRWWLTSMDNATYLSLEDRP